MRFQNLNGYIFEYQTPATLNQAAPVQNTWYTLLDTTANVILYHIGAGVEDTNEDLECQITIDGETMGSLAYSATHSTKYLVVPWINAIGRTDDLYMAAVASTISPLMIQGKSIKVELRKTTAAGAGNLVGICTYGVLKAA